MREFKDSITKKGDDDEDDADDGGRREATAALGRPDDEPATQPVSDGVSAEKR